jgi:hypothetical protein
MCLDRDPITLEPLDADPRRRGADQRHRPTRRAAAAYRAFDAREATKVVLTTGG